MDRSRWREEADAIARGVAAIASGRRLAGLTISLPPTVLFDDFREILGASLVSVGFPNVDLEARVRAGPIRVIAAEFVR